MANTSHQQKQTRVQSLLTFADKNSIHIHFIYLQAIHTIETVAKNRIFRTLPE
jgi:hypothetical protein